MFGFFKKRAALPTAEELTQVTLSAREDIKAKWVYFHQTIHLKPEVPLSQKIDMFAQPVHEFVAKKYPLLSTAPPDVFWLTLFTAILESETHSKENVNEAIAELERKYAPG